MDNLLSDIEAFVAANAMSEWAFGEGELNDRRFISELRNGREPRRKTLARVRHFMDTYQSREAA